MNRNKYDPTIDGDVDPLDVPYVSARELLVRARFAEGRARRYLALAAPGSALREFWRDDARAARDEARMLRRWAASIVSDVVETREWDAERPRVYLSIDLVDVATGDVVPGVPVEV